MRKLLLLLLSAMLLTGCAADNTAQNTAGKTEQAAKLQIKVLDVGQGDAVLIRTGQQNILLDTGDKEHENRLVSLLKQEGVTVLDKLIITHPHLDHLGGAAAVMKSFTVREVMDNGRVVGNGVYKKYLKVIKDKKITYRTLKAGDKLELGGNVQLEVLNPMPERLQTEENLNNTSIMAMLRSGKFSMLLTGDCEAEVEKELTRLYGSKLKADVLKSPHHGSKTSSNRSFLKAVRPAAAIISLGAGNDYKHPHKTTLNKYADLKIAVYRTDINGTVTVTVENGEYRIEGEKQK